MHHIEQLVVAPAALDVIADSTRLIVGDDHLRGVFGPDKAAVELRHRKELFIANGDYNLRRHAIAPLGRGFGFLMNREAFGEPARYAMVGGCENENVTHLVPERASPIEFAGLAA